MVIYEFGDMWKIYPYTDIFCFTGCSSKNRNGELVMGSGFALQVKKRYPALPIALGRAVRTGRYLTLFEPKPEDGNKEECGYICAFQTKRSFRDASEIDLIYYSFRRLLSVANSLAERQNKVIRIDLNFPGIGLGKLNINVVVDIIYALKDLRDSDKVHIHLWVDKAAQYEEILRSDFRNQSTDTVVSDTASVENIKTE